MRNPLWEFGEHTHPTDHAQNAVGLLTEKLNGAEQLLAELPARIESIKTELAKWEAILATITETAKNLGFDEQPQDSSPTSSHLPL